MNRKNLYLSMLGIKLFGNISFLIHGDDGRGISELAGRREKISENKNRRSDSSPLRRVNIYQGKSTGFDLIYLFANFTFLFPVRIGMLGENFSESARVN